MELVLVKSKFQVLLVHIQYEVGGVVIKSKFQVFLVPN